MEKQNSQKKTQQIVVWQVFEQCRSTENRSGDLYFETVQIGRLHHAILGIVQKVNQLSLVVSHDNKEFGGVTLRNKLSDLLWFTTLLVDALQDETVTEMYEDLLNTVNDVVYNNPGLPPDLDPVALTDRIENSGGVYLCDCSFVFASAERIVDSLIKHFHYNKDMLIDIDLVDCVKDYLGGLFKFLDKYYPDICGLISAKDSKLVQADNSTI